MNAFSGYGKPMDEAWNRRVTGWKRPTTSLTPVAFPMPQVEGHPPSLPYPVSRVQSTQLTTDQEVVQYDADPNPRPIDNPFTLERPEAFYRPVDRNLPFTSFPDTFIQGADRLFDGVPRMSRILLSHDVFDEDWDRFMKDVALAWANKFPEEMSKNSAIVARLVNSWNSSFFMARGVEIVFYRGRERRSGPHAGRLDRDVINFDEPEDDVSTSDSESEGESEFSMRAGSGTQDPLAEVYEIGRRQRARAEADRKRRRREKNRKRRERMRDRKYWLLLTSIPMTGLDRDHSIAEYSTAESGMGG